MKNILLLLLVCFTFACSNSGPAGKVLVDVNGDSITESDLQFLAEINPRIRSQLMSPAGKQQLIDNLTEQALLYQAAVKKGLHRRPEVKEKIELYQRVIISQALVEEKIEEAAKKYYDENQSEFNKLALSHIMINFTAGNDKDAKKQKDKTARSEAQALKLAQEIKARLDKGEKFEDLAKALSEDTATNKREGQLGLASKNDRRLEARGFGPLLEKAFEMKVGEVSGPIKTSKGYHLITLTKGAEVEPFDTAQERIVHQVHGKAQQDLIANLKKDAKILYPEKQKEKAEAPEINSGAKTEENAETKNSEEAPEHAEDDGHNH